MEAVPVSGPLPSQLWLIPHAIRHPDYIEDDDQEETERVECTRRHDEGEPCAVCDYCWLCQAAGTPDNMWAAKIISIGEQAITECSAQRVGALMMEFYNAKVYPVNRRPMCAEKMYKHLTQHSVNRRAVQVNTLSMLSDAMSQVSRKCVNPVHPGHITLLIKLAEQQSKTLAALELK